MMFFVWIALIILFGTLCVFFSYSLINPDIKKTFPKEKYLYLSNKLNYNEKYSPVYEDLKKLGKKFFFNKDILFIYIFITGISTFFLIVTVKLIYIIVSMFHKTFNIDLIYGLSYIPFLFFLFITIATAWVSWRVYFDNIYDDIYHMHYEKEIKRLKISTPRKEWEDDY